ncbi:hypothetical protein H9P43_003910 [Blastocladiella emersonii ATCC 22665]|nr:hypothetical protein H9P43_003910 [Blastocladiella emersonii ATCC 22665]
MRSSIHLAAPTGRPTSTSTASTAGTASPALTASQVTLVSATPPPPLIKTTAPQSPPVGRGAAVARSSPGSPTTPTFESFSSRTSPAGSAGGGLDDRPGSGRIKVFVRVRPLLPPEITAREPNVVATDAARAQIGLLEHGSSATSASASFAFDTVFPGAATNRDVYAVVGQPLVHACLRGFNGTLIAYGQTGSGKTLTLSSPDGMIPRALHQLFRKMQRDKYRCTYRVKLSYMQIYQEKIYDLLGDADSASSAIDAGHELPLREHPEHGVFVEGLSEHPAKSEAEVLDLLAHGQSRLVFAETKMNRHSSRSHAICFLTVERHPNRVAAATGLTSSLSRSSFHSLSTAGSMIVNGQATTGPSTSLAVRAAAGAAAGSRAAIGPAALGRGVSTGTVRNGGFAASAAALDESNVANGATGWSSDEDDDAGFDLDDPFFGENPEMVVRGRLTLCDLAGSERVKKTMATGTQLSEAKEINLSLLELGNVIQALAESKKHIPFRNSTLTRLLQESLGGNCLTSLIVCVSPAKRDMSETKGTLLFGYRAMRIKTHARINVEVDHEKRAAELAETLSLKELEWSEKERTYRRQIEDLRSAAVNLTRPAAEVSASTKLAQALDELTVERTRYRMVLDAFATAVEGMQAAAGTVRALLVHDVATARCLAQLNEVALAAATEPDPALGMSSNVRRMHSLAQPRGLGDALDRDRDSAARALLDVVAGDSEVGTAAATAPTVRDGLTAAAAETRRLAMARLESLVALAAGGMGAIRPASVLAAAAAAGASSRGARGWSAQLALAGQALDAAAAVGVPGSTPPRSRQGSEAVDAADYDEHSDAAAERDIHLLSSVARSTTQAVVRASQVVQALHAAGALSHGGTVLDRDRAEAALARLLDEHAELHRLLAHAEKALGIEVDLDATLTRRSRSKSPSARRGSGTGSMGGAEAGSLVDRVNAVIRALNRDPADAETEAARGSEELDDGDDEGDQDVLLASGSGSFSARRRRGYSAQEQDSQQREPQQPRPRRVLETVGSDGEIVMPEAARTCPSCVIS